MSPAERSLRAQIAEDVAAYADAVAELIDSPNSARLAFATAGSIIREGGVPRD